MPLAEVIRQRIRDEGPLPFATYAKLALYHPEFGYYARADQRSGRAGDFFTSVDLGPLFGEMLAVQCAEMWRHLGTEHFDLVEAGAGSGRLSRDLLDAAACHDRAFYEAVNLHLVERSPVAGAAQAKTLAHHKARLVSTGPVLPPRETISGALLANELLDALPPHVLMMTDDGLHEVYVDSDASGALVERLGPLSSPRVQAHIDEWKIVLQPGWRVEIAPDAVDWVRQAVDSMQCGFLILIDYGHEANELYSPSHATGTLATYSQHRVETTTTDGAQPWLISPGSRDITAHVDLTAVRKTAESAGAITLGILDQTYFLLGLGAAERVDTQTDANEIQNIRRRLAMKSLLIPGGLGSTQKVMIFAKHVGSPALSGLSYQIRTT